MPARNGKQEMTFQVLTCGLCHSKNHETRADADAEIDAQAIRTARHIGELRIKISDLRGDITEAQEYQDSLIIVGPV